MAVIRGWIHEPGRHCASAALHDVMTFHGRPLSEAMCFGLGRGLGVIFVKSEFLKPTLYMMPRAATLEGDFFETLRIPFTWRIDEDCDRVWNVTRSWIDRGVPMLLRTDLFHLAYYNSKIHFAGHVVVLWGYDEAKGEAYLSDTHWPGLQTVTLENLRKARYVPVPPIPITNHFFEVEPPASLPPLDEVLPGTVRRQAEAMLAGSDLPGAVGVAGIRAFAEELDRWGEAPDWKWAARYAYQVIEKRGTGGGAFRNLYRDFLVEAEAILAPLRGGRFAERMDEIARTWSELAGGMKETSESEEASIARRARPAALRVADLEERFWTDLLKVPLVRDAP